MREILDSDALVCQALGGRPPTVRSQSRGRAAACLPVLGSWPSPLPSSPPLCLAMARGPPQRRGQVISDEVDAGGQRLGRLVSRARVRARALLVCLGATTVPRLARGGVGTERTGSGSAPLVAAASRCRAASQRLPGKFATLRSSFCWVLSSSAPCQQ
jgi:hypothetical protein